MCARTAHVNMHANMDCKTHHHISSKLLKNFYFFCKIIDRVSRIHQTKSEHPRCVNVHAIRANIGPCVDILKQLLNSALFWGGQENESFSRGFNEQ